MEAQEMKRGDLQTVSDETKNSKVQSNMIK
jgi:hypothetical protein